MKALLIALPIFLGAMEAQAGWVIEDKGGPVVKMQSGRLRFEYPGHGAYIVDTTRGTLTLVAGPLRAYATESIGKVCRQIRRMGIRGTQSSKTIPTVRSAFVADGPSIAGQDTIIYDLLVDGRAHSRVWLSKSRAVRLDLGDFELDWLIQLERCGLGWSAIAEEAFGVSSPVDSSKAFLKLLRQGWIMKRVLTESKEEVTHAKTMKDVVVDFKEFQGPEGFRSIPMGQMLRALSKLE